MHTPEAIDLGTLIESEFQPSKQQPAWLQEIADGVVQSHRASLDELKGQGRRGDLLQFIGEQDPE